MGLTRIREDSVAALRTLKSRAELQAENEQLRAKVETLEGQLTDTQIALCDLFEAVMGGDDNG